MMSSAQNIPTIKVSSTRNAIMYSLTRILTAVQLERMQIGVSRVDSRTLCALRATISGSPRMITMTNAPISGRKVTSDSRGKSFIAAASMRPGHGIPRDQQHHPDQHGEGVVIDVAGLQ